MAMTEFENLGRIRRDTQRPIAEIAAAGRSAVDAHRSSAGGGT
jgi:hypothetical protein